MIATDAHGMVVGFSYHDGYLDGFLLSEDGATLTLFLRSSGGDCRRMVLRGLDGLVAHDVRNGNIVGYMFWRPIDSALRDGDVAQRLTELGDTGKWESWRELGLSVFSLHPSYGAEVVAVCKTVELVP